MQTQSTSTLLAEPYSPRMLSLRAVFKASRHVAPGDFLPLAERLYPDELRQPKGAKLGPAKPSKTGTDKKATREAKGEKKEVEDEWTDELRALGYAE